MRVHSRVITAVVTALVVMVGIGVGSAAAVPADVTAVGSRLINGDGDTSGKCLEISNGGTGAGVQMAGCHTNAHQSWAFIDLGSGWVQIRSHDADARGKCLTARGEDFQVIMATCDGADDQDWYRNPASNGWFQLYNPYWGNQCLDVENNGLSNVVQTWLCGPLNKGNQLWHWHSVG
jgi:hypothetical protein